MMCTRCVVMGCIVCRLCACACVCMCMCVYACACTCCMYVKIATQHACTHTHTTLTHKQNARREYTAYISNVHHNTIRILLCIGTVLLFLEALVGVRIHAIHTAGQTPSTQPRTTQNNVQQHTTVHNTAENNTAQTTQHTITVVFCVHHGGVLCACLFVYLCVCVCVCARMCV